MYVSYSPYIGILHLKELGETECRHECSLGVYQAIDIFFAYRIIFWSVEIVSTQSINVVSNGLYCTGGRGGRMPCYVSQNFGNALPIFRAAFENIRKAQRIYWLRVTMLSQYSYAARMYFMRRTNISWFHAPHQYQFHNALPILVRRTNFSSCHAPHQFNFHNCYWCVAQYG